MKTQRSILIFSALYVCIGYAANHTQNAYCQTFLWTTTQGEGGGEGLYVDSEQNIYFHSYGTPTVIKKYTSSGSEMWSFRPDRNGSMAVDSEGNIYVLSGSYNNFSLRKYTANRAPLWEKSIRGPAYAIVVTSIIIDRQNNVFLAGDNIVDDYERKAWIAKWDSSGTEKWQNTFSYGKWNKVYVRSSAVDPDEHLYIVGSVGWTEEDIFFAKFDKDGRVLWNKRYNGATNQHDEGWRIATDTDKNVVVSGFVDKPWVGYDRSAWLAKFDSLGNQVWAKALFRKSSILPKGLAVDGENNIYIAGSGILQGLSYLPYLHKYDKSGTNVWTFEPSFSTSTFFESIDLDASNNVYFVGEFVDWSSGKLVYPFWFGKIGFTKNYYFPYYPTTTSESAGFAVSCYDSAADVQLALRGPDGGLLPVDVNPHAQSIPAHQQVAKMGYELFSAAQPVSAAAAWVEMSSTVPVGTFFQMLSNDRMDGAVAFTEPYSRLFLTRVCEGASAFRGQRAVTRVNIANPTDSGVTLKLRLLSAAGAAVVPELDKTIAAKGVLSGTLTELFGLNRAVSDGYVDVEVVTGGGVVAFESVLLPDRNSVIGLNAQPTNASQTLYSAQLAYLPVMYTSLKLVNTSAQAHGLTFTPINEQGQPLSNPAVRTLNGGSALEIDASSLFGFPADSIQIGSLRVEVDGPGVIGDVIFGDSIGFTTAAALPLQTGGFRKAVFSQVANGMGIYNGLALFNPGTEIAEVIIDVFTAQGVKSGEKTIQLGPGNRLSKLLLEPELMPSTAGQIGGYIVIQSSHPLVAQELFGTATFLSAVPPMVIE